MDTNTIDQASAEAPAEAPIIACVKKRIAAREAVKAAEVGAAQKRKELVKKYFDYMFSLVLPLHGQPLPDGHRLVVSISTTIADVVTILWQIPDKQDGKVVDLHYMLSGAEDPEVRIRAVRRNRPQAPSDEAFSTIILHPENPLRWETFLKQLAYEVWE